MKEFLEQLGFEDITPDNPFDIKYPLNKYFEWYKPFHALYKRGADNGISTYIKYGTEGGKYYVDIISKDGPKCQLAHLLVPSDYVKLATFDLLTCVDKVLTL